MKKLPIFVLLVPLTGCYSIVSINLGSVEHQAATTGPPISAEVQCAALAADSIHTPDVNIDAVKICENITEKEAAKAAKAAKK
jgi:hypothetical protein